MKANELMIGDWVTFCGNMHKVESIDIEFGYNITDNDNLIKPEEISPIPLTEEILKANGFVYDPNNDGNNVWVLRRERKYRVDIYPYYQATVINISSDIADRIGENNCHICYQCHVHELQHALRLCGLNELADNFKIS